MASLHAFVHTPILAHNDLLCVPGVHAHNLAHLTRAGVDTPARLLTSFLEQHADARAMRGTLRVMGLDEHDAATIVSALEAKKAEMAKSAPLLGNDMSLLPPLSPRLRVKLAVLGLDTPCALLALAIKADLDAQQVFVQLWQLLMLCCTESLSCGQEWDNVEDDSTDDDEVRRIVDIMVHECRFALQV
jgi:hypothetical protein